MSNGPKKDINWPAIVIVFLVVAIVAFGGYKACARSAPEPLPADSTAIRPHPVPAIVDTGVKTDSADSARR